MVNIKILKIKNKLITYRKLYSYDYNEFIKLSKEIINKGEFKDKYLNNKDLYVKVGTSISQDKIVLIVIFKDNKVNKLIYDPEYDLNDILKKINI